jgi:hypothetical protein
MFKAIFLVYLAYDFKESDLFNFDFVQIYKDQKTFIYYFICFFAFIQLFFANGIPNNPNLHVFNFFLLKTN